MDTVTPDSAPKFLRKAREAQKEGKIGEAGRTYEAILKADPKCHEAHYELGCLFLKMNETRRAALFLQNALKLKLGESLYWRHYADALVALKDKQLTSAFIRQTHSAGLPDSLAKELRAKFQDSTRSSVTDLGEASQADFDSLADLALREKFGEALKKASELSKAHPKVAAFANMEGYASARLGKRKRAGESFLRAIQLDPGYAEAHANYGEFLLEESKLEEAREFLDKALELAPGLVSALIGMGQLLVRSGELFMARGFLSRVLAEQPKNPLALYWSGRLSEREQNSKDAAMHYRKAIKAGLDIAEIRTRLGVALGLEGMTEEALAELNLAIKMDPEYAKGYSDRANVLQKKGDFEAAERDLLKAIELKPQEGHFYQSYALGRKMREGDPLIPEMEKHFKSPDITEESRRQFGYALSKVMEDTERHGRVFEYLNAANSITRKMWPYDFEEARRDADLAKKGYESIKGRVFEDGIEDFSPIFVTGAPRSGTTLVEQIISSHSEVAGAGELGAFTPLVFMALEKGGAAGAVDSNDLESDLLKAGREYVEFLSGRFPGYSRVTDKTISTYAYIGYVLKVFPGARVVVVRRDPRDNCFSMYKNRFADGLHRYTYGFDDLAKFYGMFEGLVEFWRGEIPGSFYEVRYEDLVENPEEETRRLIEACGLAWEDACLDFHKNARRVDTLSFYQVRQKMYSSSVGSWKRYEEDLRPLTDLLGKADLLNRM